jgi:hypothetical protein
MALSAAWFGAGLVALYVARVYAQWRHPAGAAQDHFDVGGALIVSWFLIGSTATGVLALLDHHFRH